MTTRSWCGRLAAYALALALALAAAAPGTLVAQATRDRDAQAVSSYTLTMPKYKQYLGAMVELANEATKNPNAFKSLEGSAELPLDRQIALYDANPAMKKAITGAGMTTRDFLLTQYALLQTGMAYAVMKEYKLSADSVARATGVNRANLEFYQQNEAELTRLGEEAKAKMPPPPPAEDAGDDGDGGDRD